MNIFWLYTLSPFILFLGIGVYVDRKNKKYNNVREKIDRNEYKYKAFEELDRYNNRN